MKIQFYYIFTFKTCQLQIWIFWCIDISGCRIIALCTKTTFHLINMNSHLENPFFYFYFPAIFGLFPDFGAAFRDAFFKFISNIWCSFFMLLFLPLDRTFFLVFIIKFFCSFRYI